MSTDIKYYYDKKLIEWKSEKTKGKKIKSVPELWRCGLGAACGTWTAHPSRASKARGERPRNWICDHRIPHRWPRKIIAAPRLGFHEPPRISG